MNGDVQNEVIEFSEWEGSKENIQPLKRGRKASELRKVFAPLSTIQTNDTTGSQILHDPTVICFNNHNNRTKLTIEREQWERKLLEFSEDPLLTWIDYLTWIEDNYPTLDKSSQFVETLKRCTSTFLNDMRYKTDRRYVLLWLRYADTCSDPVDVYAFMHTNGVGLEVAEFYISWSMLLEDRKDLRAADAILNQGIMRNAQPFEKIKLYTEGFKQRFMEGIMKNVQNPMTQQRNVLQQNNAPQMNANPFGFQRVAFNPLSTAQARSGERPVAMQTPTSMTPIRAAPVKPAIGGVKKIAKKITGVTAVKRKPLSGNFQVFDESTMSQPKKRRVENASVPSLDFNQPSRVLPFDLPPDQKPTWTHLPSEQEQEKENVDRPTMWTNYRVPQEEDQLSTYRPQTQQQPISFSVFEDESEN